MTVQKESEYMECPAGWGDLPGGARRSRPTFQKQMDQKKGVRLRSGLVWVGNRLVSWGRRLEERGCAANQTLRPGR